MHKQRRASSAGCHSATSTIYWFVIPPLAKMSQAVSQPCSHHSSPRLRFYEQGCLSWSEPGKLCVEVSNPLMFFKVQVRRDASSLRATSNGGCGQGWGPSRNRRTSAAPVTPTPLDMASCRLGRDLKHQGMVLRPVHVHQELHASILCE